MKPKPRATCISQLKFLLWFLRSCSFKCRTFFWVVLSLCVSARKKRRHAHIHVYKYQETLRSRYIYIFTDSSNNNEAICRVHMSTCHQGFILPLLQWLFISINLPRKRHLVKLRQTNQCKVDAHKFIKTVLNENVLIQHQGSFHFFYLMRLQSIVIVQNIILLERLCSCSGI